MDAGLIMEFFLLNKEILLSTCYRAIAYNKPWNRYIFTDSIVLPYILGLQ